MYCSELAFTLLAALFSVSVYECLTQFLFHAGGKLDMCASLVR